MAVAATSIQSNMHTPDKLTENENGSPAVDDDRKSGTPRAFYQTLLDTQWSTPLALAQFQEETVGKLIAHAIHNVPYYRDRLKMLYSSGGAVNLSKWLQVPVMKRKDVEANYQSLIAQHVPKAHGALKVSSSSATSGPALVLRKTQLQDTATACASFRHADAFGLDWSRPLIMARALVPEPRRVTESREYARHWGPHWLPRESRGARVRLSIHLRPEDLLGVLRQNAPAFLNTSPAKAADLTAYIARSGETAPDIAGILTVGEYVSDDLRDQCRRYLNCEIIDVYSTAECGVLATQCPVSGGYHMQPELSLLEVLNDAGRPCRPGETGRVTATPLYNYAMPLIRYQYDDLVTVGKACTCGRPAPLLSKVHGRSDHHFVLDDGRLFRPEPATEEMRKYVGFRRWQLAQTGQASAELRIAMHPVSGVPDAAGAAAYVASLFDTDMEVSVRTNVTLGLTGGGKFATIVRDMPDRV